MNFSIKFTCDKVGHYATFYSLRIFFYLGFLSLTFTIHGTVGEGGVYLFNNLSTTSTRFTGNSAVFYQKDLSYKNFIF